jgi:hypothetical protein
MGFLEEHGELLRGLKKTFTVSVMNYGIFHSKWRGINHMDERLLIPGEFLEATIDVIKAGLERVNVEPGLRKHLVKWCDEQENYLTFTRVRKDVKEKEKTSRNPKRKKNEDQQEPEEFSLHE